MTSNKSPQGRKWLVYALGGAALLILPLLLQGMGNFWVRIADTALLYILLAIGLNIVVGYAGLLALGFVAFFAFLLIFWLMVAKRLPWAG